MFVATFLKTRLKKMRPTTRVFCSACTDLARVMSLKILKGNLNLKDGVMKYMWRKIPTCLEKKTMENTFEEGISMETGLQYFCQIVGGLDYCWIYSQTRNFLYQDHT